MTFVAAYLHLKKHVTAALLPAIALALCGTSVRALELVTVHELSTSPNQAAGGSAVRFKLVLETDTEYADVLALRKTDYFTTGRSFKAFKYDPAVAIPSHLDMIGIYRLSLRTKANLNDARSDIYVLRTEYCSTINTSTELFTWKDPAQPLSTETCTNGNPPSFTKPVFVASSACGSRTPYAVIRYFHQASSNADYTNHRFVASGFDDDDVMTPLKPTWVEEGGVFCVPDLIVPNPTGNAAKGPITSGANTTPEYISYKLLDAIGQPGSVATLNANEAATARLRFRNPLINATVTPVAINGIGPQLSSTTKNYPAQLDGSAATNADGLYHVDVPIKAAPSGDSNFYVSALGSLGQISAPALVTIKGAVVVPKSTYKCAVAVNPTSQLAVGATLTISINGTGEANTTCALPTGSTVTISVSGNGLQTSNFSQNIFYSFPNVLSSPILNVGIVSADGSPVTTVNAATGASPYTQFLSLRTVTPEPPTATVPVCSKTSQSPNPASAGANTTINISCSNMGSQKVWYWTYQSGASAVSQVNGSTSAGTFAGSFSITAATGMRVFVVAADSQPTLPAFSSPNSGFPQGSNEISLATQTAANTCTVGTSFDGSPLQEGPVTGTITSTPSAGSSAAACSAALYKVVLTDAMGAAIDTKNGIKAGDPLNYAGLVVEPGAYTLTFTPPTDVAVTNPAKTLTVNGCKLALAGGLASVAPGQVFNVDVLCNSSAATQIDFAVTGATTQSATVSGAPIGIKQVPLVAAGATGTLLVTPTIKASANLIVKALSAPIQTAPCTITPPNPTTIALSAGATAAANFKVDCVNATSLTYTIDSGVPVAIGGTPLASGATASISFSAKGSYNVAFTAKDANNAAITITGGATAAITITPPDTGGALDTTRDVPRSYIPAGCPATPSDVTFLEDAYNVLFNGPNSTIQSGVVTPISGRYLWGAGGARADIRAAAGKTIVFAFYPLPGERYAVSTNESSPAGPGSAKKMITSRCPGSFDPAHAVDPANTFCLGPTPGLFPRVFLESLVAPNGCPIYKAGPSIPVYVNIRQIDETSTSDFSVTVQ